MLIKPTKYLKSSCYDLEKLFFFTKKVTPSWLMLVEWIIFMGSPCGIIPIVHLLIEELLVSKYLWGNLWTRRGSLTDMTFTFFFISSFIEHVNGNFLSSFFLAALQSEPRAEIHQALLSQLFLLAEFFIVEVAVKHKDRRVFNLGKSLALVPSGHA